MPGIVAVLFAFFCAAAVVPTAAAGEAAPCPAGSPCSIRIDSDDLQSIVDAAPPYATLLADSAHEIEIAKTVRIDKPLTFVGLKARLRAGVGNTHMLEVVSEGVIFTEFALTGNIESVPYKDRASLIVFRKGGFRVENGSFHNSAKDGVMVNPTEATGAIEHGVIRDIVGVNNARDVISISGAGQLGLPVRHLLVENIRCFGSRDRGAVEVSDGSEDVTVRDIYSESSYYGVDVQDHRKPGQVNRNVVIDGVRVKDCPIAIRTANSDFGHDGLMIRNVSGEQWRQDKWRPLHITNTANVFIDNVRIRGAEGAPAVVVRNSDNVILRDVVLLDAANDGEAVLVEDANHLLLDNVMFLGSGAGPAVGIRYLVRSDGRFEDLRIRNSVARRVRDVGIALESAGQGRLEGYSLVDNEATVRDDIGGLR